MMRRLWIMAMTAFISCLAGLPAFAAPLATSFLYQGNLKSGFDDLNATADFECSLWDLAAGGTQFGSTVQVTNVQVADGIFTIELDFGVDVFNGSARWLEIAVRTPSGGGAFTTLSPRQPLTAVPYSLQTRGIFVTSDNKIGIGFANPVHEFDMARGTDMTARFSTLSHNDGARIILKNINFLGSFLFNLGSLEFHDEDDVMQGGMLYRRTFLGDRLVFSAGGEEQIYVDQFGQMGVKTSFPFSTLHVQSNSLSVNANHVSNEDVIVEASDATLGLYSSGGGSFGSAITMKEMTTGDVGGELVDTWGIIRETTGGGSDLRFTYGTSDEPSRNDTMMQLTDDGFLGMGISNPSSKLHVVEFGDEPLMNVAGFGTGQGARISLTNGNNPNPALTVVSNGTGPAIDVSGSVRTDVIEILGADVAEKFPASETAEPGMVMAIDPNSPGEICVARGAYNRCVAGVVSGANGLPAGAVLGNLPESADGPAIALSGRVWVYCDAANGAIAPGDLLTTSLTPGHAMRVTDHARASGATLGKAMTALAEGERGLVLTLVALH